MKRRVAPIERRMAISRPFSMTTITRLEMMLKAATRMIRVRMRNMVTFSSLRAEKRLRFMSIQSRAQ